MPTVIQTHISRIQMAVQQVFAQLDAWFQAPAEVCHFRPASGGWTIDEILEHTALTNHFLLVLIEKGAAKALKNAGGLHLQEELATYSFKQTKLDEVGLHQYFPWMRPNHMEPTGTKPSAEVQTQLHQQRKQCEQVLARLPNGEGVFYRTTMSVNELGKLDVYEYVYFLAKHAERHLMQIAKTAAGYHHQATQPA